MRLRTFLALPGIFFIGLIAAIYIIGFRFDLVRTLDLPAIVQMVNEQRFMIEILPDLVSVVFYLFIFKIIFL